MVCCIALYPPAQVLIISQSDSHEFYKGKRNWSCLFCIYSLKKIEKEKKSKNITDNTESNGKLQTEWVQLGIVRQIIFVVFCELFHKIKNCLRNI